MTINGHPVNANSLRYVVYKKKGCVCKFCSRKGTHFKLQRSVSQKDQTEKYHFNLYGTDENNNEFMMTVDHAMPRSKVGKIDSKIFNLYDVHSILKIR